MTNPAFDHDLSGWVLEQGSAVWSAQDAAASPSSGSVDATPVGGQHAAIRSNCFAASPGSYLFEFKHREPNAQDPFGINAFLRWYSDADCTVLLSNSVSANSTFHYPTWQTIGTAFFGVDAVAPSGTRSAALQLNAFGRSYVDDVVVARLGACTAAVCLHDGRFAVDVRWFTGPSNGQGIPIHVTGDSATYWFFGAGNIELVVKVLDGCAINGRYWVFLAGLTDVRVEVTVTDVTTGETWRHENPQGMPFPPVQATSAFPTCP
ncbi:MAG TPA: hypothetical protein VFS60_20230 [Thermoanaerobaculia bacterium]|nr:hypothetical protein [Thermoanaerobaculia bacterium]